MTREQETRVAAAVFGSAMVASSAQALRTECPEWSMPIGLAAIVAAFLLVKWATR